MEKKKNKMMLYIWPDIRRDYTSGIGFAAATSKEEAIEAIHKVSEDWEWNAYAGELLTSKCEVHELPYGGWISGGG
jgi:hypothetical protein